MEVQDSIQRKSLARRKKMTIRERKRVNRNTRKCNVRGIWQRLNRRHTTSYVISWTLKEEKRRERETLCLC